MTQICAAAMLIRSGNAINSQPHKTHGTSWRILSLHPNMFCVARVQQALRVLYH